MNYEHKLCDNNNKDIISYKSNYYIDTSQAQRDDNPSKLRVTYVIFCMPAICYVPCYVENNILCMYVHA